MAVPVAKSRLGHILRLSAKLGIVGGAVYWTTTTGIWSKDTTQNAVAIKGFTETVDTRLGGEYFTKVGLPSSHSIAGKWNNGVSYTFDAAAELPGAVSRGYQKAKNYVSNTK